MPSVYLIGGGRGEDAVRASHTPFVHAVGEQAIVVLVLDSSGSMRNSMRFLREAANAFPQ